MKNLILTALILLFSNVIYSQTYIVNDVFIEKNKNGQDFYHAEFVCIENETGCEVDTLVYLSYYEEYWMVDYLPIIAEGDTLIVGEKLWKIIPKDYENREKEVNIFNKRGKVKYTRLYEFKNGEIKITTKTKNRIKEDYIFDL